MNNAQAEGVLEIQRLLIKSSSLLMRVLQSCKVRGKIIPFLLVNSKDIFLLIVDKKEELYWSLPFSLTTVFLQGSMRLE